MSIFFPNAVCLSSNNRMILENLTKDPAIYAVYNGQPVTEYVRSVVTGAIYLVRQHVVGFPVERPIRTMRDIFVKRSLISKHDRQM